MNCLIPCACYDCCKPSGECVLASSVGRVPPKDWNLSFGIRRYVAVYNVHSVLNSPWESVVNEWWRRRQPSDINDNKKCFATDAYVHAYNAARRVCDGTQAYLQYLATEALPRDYTVTVWKGLSFDLDTLPTRIWRHVDAYGRLELIFAAKSIQDAVDNVTSWVRSCGSMVAHDISAFEHCPPGTEGMQGEGVINHGKLSFKAQTYTVNSNAAVVPVT